MIIYIGFSYFKKNKFLWATNAAIAQSDFTYSLLKKKFNCKYIICLSKNYKLLSKKSNYIPLNFAGVINQLKSIYFIIRLAKRNKAKIMVYHSFIFFFLILVLRLFNIKYILQINEIYSNFSDSLFYKKKLENIIFKITKSFIFSSKKIQNIVKKNNNLASLDDIPIIPGPILFSNYKFKHPKSTQIKIVYSGIIDKKKEGAFIALNLAKKLNDKKYAIYIYGFGFKNDVECLKKKINENNLVSFTKAKYLGNINPYNLFKKLKRFDIGLATQNNSSFSETSFPSKILFYLGSGLFVCCRNSQPISSWKYKSLINIYKRDDLTDLVKIIKNYKRSTKKKYYLRKKLFKIYHNIYNSMIKYLQ
jgi:hypothetical protein